MQRNTSTICTTLGTHNTARSITLAVECLLGVKSAPRTHVCRGDQQVLLAKHCSRSIPNPAETDQWAADAILSEFSRVKNRVRLRGALTILVELLAAVPSVVYGLWGIFFLAPKLQPIA